MKLLPSLADRSEESLVLALGRLNLEQVDNDQ